MKNDDIMSFGWWKEGEEITGRTDCTVFHTDKPHPMSERSIVSIAQMFGAKNVTSGGKIRVYWDGPASIMEGIAGSWLWEIDRATERMDNWQLRITDESRDILVMVKKPNMRDGAVAH